MHHHITHLTSPFQLVLLVLWCWAGPCAIGFWDRENEIDSQQHRGNTEGGNSIEGKGNRISLESYLRFHFSSASTAPLTSKKKRLPILVSPSHLCPPPPAPAHLRHNQKQTNTHTTLLNFPCYRCTIFFLVAGSFGSSSFLVSCSNDNFNDRNEVNETRSIHIHLSAFFFVYSFIALHRGFFLFRNKRLPLTIRVPSHPKQKAPPLKESEAK